MSLDNNTIQIGLASDNRYHQGLIATAASMAKFAKESVRLVFNIIDGGIGASEKRSLQNLLCRYHPNSKINFFDLSRMGNGLFPAKMNYARLLFPRLLPSEDFLVYCDVDFLWMADVAELWKCRDKRYVVQTTRDIEFSQESEASWLSSKGIEIDKSQYFCSGLTLINLKLFRQDDIDIKLARFIESHPDVPLFDQTAMNALLLPMHNGVGMLPETWQRYALSVSDCDFRAPMALHYSGLCPWSGMRIIPDVVDFWFHVAARLQNCSFDEMRQQHYSRLGYIAGRMAFRLLAGVLPLKAVAVRVAKVMRGKTHAAYIKAILRRVNVDRAIEQTLN